MKKSLFVLVLVAAAAACITFLALGGTLGWRGGEETVETPAGEVLKTEQDFRDRLAALRIDRDKLVRGIQRLENKKQETMDFLVNEKGIQSSEDITDDSDVRYALRQLKGWKDEIEARQADLPKYDEAINSLEAMLAEIERKRIQEEVALSEEDYIELRKIVVDLNERLGMDEADPLEEEELYDMFDEEVSSIDGQ